MTVTRQILFIQGGGAGAHDEWDDKLVESLTSDLGARLPQGVQVHVFHGLQDETAPPSHADLYALVIPQAQVHRLPGRDHQLNNDMSEVAEAVSINRPRPVTHT
jgi:pimeloyl-ACP methyl ester carboxylesterase